MNKPRQYSVFEYLYRDAANWKAWGKLLLLGDVSPADVALMEVKLDAGEFFIPEQLGVPPLFHKLWQGSIRPSSDDHPWHELVALRAAMTEEIENCPKWGSLKTLLDRVKAVKSWDPIHSQGNIAMCESYMREFTQVLAGIQIGRSEILILTSRSCRRRIDLVNSP